MRRALVVAGLALVLAIPALAQMVVLPRASAPLMLVDFATIGAADHWTGLERECVQVDAATGLRFTFPAWKDGDNEWPALYLACKDGTGFATRDWSHYGKIAFDAWVTDLPADVAVGDIALELRDAKDRNGYAAHFALEPNKLNALELELPQVARQTDLTRIEEIVLFTTRPTHAYTVTIANLRLLPGERPPLAAFDLVYPNYRSLIFPDADRLRATVSVQLEEYGLQAEDLALRLTCDAGGRSASVRRPLGRDKASASLPVTSLRPGPVRLSAALVDRSGNALAQRDWSLRKLSADEVGNLKTYVDQHNNTIVDGKPFFPLGWYGNGTESQTLEIADSPFNCILDYGTNSKPRAQMLKYLDLVDSKGLKLIYCLNDVYPTATYYADRSWEGTKGNQAIADSVVQTYRDHPALLAWYLNDELPRSLAPKLTDYYERVAELDPDHPCYIVLCNMSELEFFTDTADVMGVDPYPIPGSPVTMVADWMEAANRATRRHMPTWLVPQAFAWYQHRPTGSDRARIPTAEELRTGRAPTYEEARCMTYLALAHGAKGIIYWCYYNMRVLPQYQEMWEEMKRIGAEVRELSPTLLSPEPAREVRVLPSDAPIHTRLMRYEGREVLIAVNAGRIPCDAELNLKRPLPPRVPVLFEDRLATTTGDTLLASFEPLEVHVYDLGGGQ